MLNSIQSVRCRNFLKHAKYEKSSGVAGVQQTTVFMVALWNRADSYIFILSFVLLLSFFPRLISAVTDWMSAILPHMVWP